MGRKALPFRPRIYRIVLSLHPGRDDDLIAYLEAIPQRGLPAAIITAMRGGNLTSTLHDDLADDELEEGLDALMF